MLNGHREIRNYLTMDQSDYTNFPTMIHILRNRDAYKEKANSEMIEAVVMRNADAMAVASSKLQQIDDAHNAIARTKVKVQESPPELRLIYLFMAGCVDVNLKKSSGLNFVNMLFSQQESAEDSNAVEQ